MRGTSCSGPSCLIRPRPHSAQRSYWLRNACGETLPLAEVWQAGGPQKPSGGGFFTAGAGDCAAPKLLSEAFARGLRPTGLAEVWFGAPSVSRVVTSRHMKHVARMKGLSGRDTPDVHVMTRVKVQRAEGRFYPCCEKCRRILGWQLCCGSKTSLAEETAGVDKG